MKAPNIQTNIGAPQGAEPRKDWTRPHAINKRANKECQTQGKTLQIG